MREQMWYLRLHIPDKGEAMDVKDFKERHAEALEWAEGHFALMHSLVNALAVGMESLQSLEPIGEMIKKAEDTLLRLQNERSAAESETNRVKGLLGVERKKLADYKAQRSDKAAKVAEEYTIDQRKLQAKERSEVSAHKSRLADLEKKEHDVQLNINDKTEEEDRINKRLSELRESMRAL